MTESLNGKCCGCGYCGEEETPCPKREDGIHCEHWWEGNDMRQEIQSLTDELHNVRVAKDAELTRLRAARDTLAAQLCRAREWLVTAKTLNGTECSYHDPHRKKYAIKERCGKCILCLIDYAMTVHLNDAPCPHELELKIAREIVAGQEVEIREGDSWKERARESFANGTCPCCFCTDEGPHEEGCAWAEHAEEAKRLREAVEWALNELYAQGLMNFYTELRRAAGREGK